MARPNMRRVVSHAYEGERSIWLNAFQSARARKLIAVAGVVGVVYYVIFSRSSQPSSRGRASAVWTPPPAGTAAPQGRAEWKPAWSLKARAPSERTVAGTIEQFVPYLDARWVIAPPTADTQGAPQRLRDLSPFAPHVWLTVANAETIDGSTAALGLFVDEMNRERVMRGGATTRQTSLVVLCEDGECLSSCEERKLFCFGGPKLLQRKPARMESAEWIKMHALIRVLETRDAFFVSPSINFRIDPYPMLLDLMAVNDVVAPEDDLHDHISTNLIWMRRGPTIVDLWKKVLELELDGSGQSQARLNELFGSSRLRRPEGPTSRRDDWKSPQGLRMHALNSDRFYNLRYYLQGLTVPRAQSFTLDTSCGGDAFTQAYIAKTLGYWGNVDSYFSLPPKTITIGHLGGTRADVLQMMKILLAAGHYTQRAVELPPTVTLRFQPDHLASTIPIYSAFPLGQIEQGLSVRILEPKYSHQHAPKYLLGGSVDEHGGLAQSLDQGWESKSAREAKVVQLLEQHAVLDMRQTPTFSSFIEHLLRPSLKARQAVRLHNFDWPGPSPTHFEWRAWDLPQVVKQVELCGKLGAPVQCGEMCAGTRRRWVEGEWPTTDDVLAEERDRPRTSEGLDS